MVTLRRLSHPLLVRVRRDASDVDASGRQVHEEQNVVRHQSALSPHLRGGEICRRDDVHVGADELPPGGGLLSLRGRRYAPAFQNVTDGFSESTRGGPGYVRFVEPSNFLATSLRCQHKIVSGVTMLVTSSRARLPKRFPISASVNRSAFVRRKRPWI